MHKSRYKSIVSSLLVFAFSVSLVFPANAAEQIIEVEDSQIGDFTQTLPIDLDLGIIEEVSEDTQDTSKTEPIEKNTSQMALSAGDSDVEKSYETRTNRTNVLKNDEYSGGLVYQYLIPFAPGRNGVKPDSILAYNSQNMDHGSLFGSGWSFTIPYIERMNKKGVDKMYSELDFTSSFSGELVFSGNDKYIARNSNDVTEYIFVNNYWQYTDKTGTVYKFGQSANSRLDNPGNGSQINKWLLEESRDTNNNYIKYEYYKDGGQIYPSKIKYTGNDINPGVIEVEFLRELRPDVVKSAKAGFPIVTNYRIKEIILSVNAVWNKKVTLIYSSGDNTSRSLLKEIKESGKNDIGAIVTNPSVIFDYQNPNNGINSWTRYDTWQSPVDLRQGVLLAEVNKDGLIDFVQGYDTSDTANDKKAVYYNNGNGTWTNANLAPPEHFRSDFSSPFDQGIREADFDGDGDGADFSKYLSCAPGAPNPVSWVFTGTEWQLEADKWNPQLEFACINSSSDTGTRIVDLNGDGLPDLINSIRAPSTGVVESKVYFNNGSDWVRDYSWSIPSSIREGVYFAELNGDGLVDYLQSHRGSSEIHKGAFINNGDGSWTEDPALFPPLDFYSSFSSPHDFGVRLADLNGDGLTDITQSLGWVGWDNVYLNKGNGWLLVQGWDSQEDWADGRNDLDTGARLFDVNGDNMVDIINARYNSNAVLETVVYLNNKTKADLLNKITYSDGGYVTVEYKASSAFRNSNGLMNPEVPYSLDLVKSIVTNDGNGNSFSKLYEYESGKYYYNTSFDRRFTGFGVVTLVDLESRTKTYFHQGDQSNIAKGEYSDHVSKAGKPYRTEKYDANGNLYSVQINKWENVDLGNGANFVKNTQTIDMTYDGNSSHKDKAVSYAYNDTNGNLTQQVEWGEVTAQDNGTFTDTGSDKFTTNITYATGSTLGVTGLPSDEVTLNQSSTKVKQTRHYYDLLTLGLVEKGNETRTEFWISGSNFTNIQKTYNALGLVTQEKDQRGKITNYTYDAYNLYPVTISQPHSVINNYQYDYSSGKVKQVTDPNGRVFQTVYDGLDRVIEEKQPDSANPANLVTKSTYTYTNLSVGEVVHKTDHLSATQTISSYTYTDGLGREIQTRTQAEDANTFAVKDIIYNSRGLVEKESLPYFSTGSAKTTPTPTQALYTSFVYDAMERPTTVTNAAGTTTNTYSDWKTTVTDSNNVPKHLYKDAYGNLIRVDEVNGASTYTTNYQYNYLGNLTKITDALGNVRNFTYDGMGRRLTAEDLHASADTTFSKWTYTYDNASNITKVVDGKNQTINYTYDDLNRIDQENFAAVTGVEVDYTYNNCVNGIGRLCKVVVLNGPTTEYEYDALGNMTKEKRTIDTVVYNTLFEYDRQGNQTLITNPDGSQFKYEYNAGGQIEKVFRKEGTDAAFVNVVIDFDYGPHGKVTEQVNANNTTTTNTYDAAKLYRLTNKKTITQNGTGGGGGTSDPVTTSFGAMVGDGAAYKENLNWASARSAATGSASYSGSTHNIRVGKNGNNEFRIDRGFLAFDTASLTDDATITNAKLKLYIDTKSNAEDDGSDWLTVTQGLQASGATLVNADYGSGLVLNNATEGVDTSERKDITNVVLNQYLVFELNQSGRGWVADDGVSKFAIRIGHDVLNELPDATTGQNNLVRFRSNGYSGTSYDPVLEVTYVVEEESGGSGPQTIQDVSYAYDNNGNVLSITDASQTDTAKVTTYAYDDLNRLLSATVTGAENGDNTVKTYSYDAIGNITASTDAGAYTYGGSSGTNYANPHAVTGLGGATYGYDRNGNLEADGVWTNTWDYQNRLAQSAKTGVTVTYAYDHSGQRVKQNNGTVATVYPSRMYNTDGTTAQKHIFANDVLVATVRGTGAGASVSLDHTDHLTGTGVVTNGNGEMVQLLDYHPFGTFRMDWKAAGTADEQRKFAGHEHDADTNLSYMNARYYNSATGKFTSIDPAYLKLDRLEIQLVDPQSWNSYAYARSNPLKYNDPDGEFWDTVIDLGFTAIDGARTVMHTGNWLGDKATSAIGKATGNTRMEAVGTKNSAQSSAALKNAASDLAVDALATSLPGFTAAVGRIDNVAKLASKSNAITDPSRLLVTPRESLLRAVSGDKKLTNYVEALYRPNAKIGDGSSMDAARREIATGLPTLTASGRPTNHVGKNMDIMKGLQNGFKKNAWSGGLKTEAIRLYNNLTDSVTRK